MVPAKIEAGPNECPRLDMVLNRQRRVPVAVGPLAQFLERVRRELRFPSQGVAVQLVSDAAMTRLNWRFRRKRGPTDVLSFPARANGARTVRAGRAKRQPRSAGSGYVGDIAISPETARRNARRAFRPLEDELRLLVLHGMIHLAGYDHETDRGQMDRFESRLRRRLGLLSK
jgi:probable rRNA maturation factor